MKIIGMKLLTIAALQMLHFKFWMKIMSMKSINVWMEKVKWMKHRKRILQMHYLTGTVQQ